MAIWTIMIAGRDICSANSWDNMPAIPGLTARRISIWCACRMSGWCIAKRWTSFTGHRTNCSIWLIRLGEEENFRLWTVKNSRLRRHSLMLSSRREPLSLWPKGSVSLTCGDGVLRKRYGTIRTEGNCAAHWMTLFKTNTRTRQTVHSPGIISIISLRMSVCWILICLRINHGYN